MRRSCIPEDACIVSIGEGVDDFHAEVRKRIEKMLLKLNKRIRAHDLGTTLEMTERIGRE